MFSQIFSKKNFFCFTFPVAKYNSCFLILLLPLQSTLVSLLLPFGAAAIHYLRVHQLNKQVIRPVCHRYYVTCPFLFGYFFVVPHSVIYQRRHIFE